VNGDADYIWLHIRSVGGWTRKLYDFFKQEEDRMKENARTANSSIDQQCANNNNCARFQVENNNGIELDPILRNNHLRRTQRPNRSRRPSSEGDVLNYSRDAYL